jgi:hypothetical protein
VDICFYSILEDMLKIPIGVPKSSSKPNVVLPEFDPEVRQRYKRYASSRVTQAVDAISSYIFGPPSAPKPTVKNVVVIGVHGWFPAKLLQRGK